MKKFFTKFRAPIIGFVFLLLISSLDVYLSYIGRTVAFESNPFARNEAHQFLISHGIGIKLWFMLFLSLGGFSLYQSFRKMDERLALILFSAPFYYAGFSTMWGAIVLNILILSNWYTP